MKKQATKIIFRDSILLQNQTSRLGLYLMRRMFANGPRDWGSIPGRHIKKKVLDAALLKIQHYKARIKGKEEQSRERNTALPYTSVL